MTGHEWEILAGAILVVIGQFVQSIFTQRRETGKRVGGLEKRVDYMEGLRDGFEKGAARWVARESTKGPWTMTTRLPRPFPRTTTSSPGLQTISLTQQREFKSVRDSLALKFACWDAKRAPKTAPSCSG